MHECQVNIVDQYQACIDVPRPLINDLWVSLLQKIDAESVNSASRAGTSVCQIVYRKYLKPFF